MTMWRAIRVLGVAGLVAIAAGAASAQATFTSIDRSISLNVGCGANFDETRSSSVLGVFNETLQASNSFGSGQIHQQSTLTEDTVSGFISANESYCSSSRGQHEVRFTIPERQWWRYQSNADGGEFPLSVLLGPDGLTLFFGSTPSTDLLLEPGEYEFKARLTCSETCSGSVSWSFSRLAPSTSQQLVYQGFLQEAGVPYTGLADVRLTLFDAASDGTQVGSPMQVNQVAVEEGKFAAAISPSIATFDAASLYAQFEVRTGGGSFVVLDGRRPMNATPFAFRASSAASADIAGTAVHAAAVDVAESATNASSAVIASEADEAVSVANADQALQAGVVPFAGIMSNPWTRSGSLVSTLLPVGLGKVPVDLLDVQGNMRINDQNFYLRGTGDVNHGVGWFGSGKPFATVAVDGPVLFGYSAGLLGTRQGGERVAVSWNVQGQVGIGTTNTNGFMLAVNGSAAKPGGGTWSVLSDPRTKSEIVPLSGALDRLMRLHGYEYTYRPEFVESGLALPGRQTGLMADEVAEVFPDWVVRGSDGYMRVAERSTTALMVEAIRDLRAEKDARVSELRERIRKLGAMVGSPAPVQR